jgi:hypothetical protein
LKLEIDLTSGVPTAGLSWRARGSEVNGRHRIRVECGTEQWVAHGPRSEITFFRFSSAAQSAAVGGSPDGADR